MNAVKSQPPHLTDPAATSLVSGKLVIIGILTIALAGAAIGWFFRYNATHRAAKFWGPQVSRLIRNAPVVEFYQISPAIEALLPEREAGKLDLFLDAADRHDRSNARGLVHLRHALLEDRSFRWPSQPPRQDMRWQWALMFRNADHKAGTILLFSPDLMYVASLDRPADTLCCEPIAAGLSEMFAEIFAETAPSAESSR